MVSTKASFVIRGMLNKFLLRYTAVVRESHHVTAGLLVFKIWKPPGVPLVAGRFFIKTFATHGRAAPSAELSRPNNSRVGLTIVHLMLHNRLIHFELLCYSIAYCELS